MARCAIGRFQTFQGCTYTMLTVYPDISVIKMVSFSMAFMQTINQPLRYNKGNLFLLSTTYTSPVTCFVQANLTLTFCSITLEKKIACFYSFTVN